MQHIIVYPRVQQAKRRKVTVLFVVADRILHRLVGQVQVQI